MKHKNDYFLEACPLLLGGVMVLIFLVEELASYIPKTHSLLGLDVLHIRSVRFLFN